MDARLTRAEEQIDMALDAVRKAQTELSITDPKEASIGGALSVIEVALNAVTDVVEHLILELEKTEE